MQDKQPIVVPATSDHIPRHDLRISSLNFFACKIMPCNSRSKCRREYILPIYPLSEWVWLLVPYVAKGSSGFEYNSNNQKQIQEFVRWYVHSIQSPCLLYSTAAGTAQIICAIVKNILRELPS